MNIKYFIKISVVLLGAIGVLFHFNMVMLQGGVFVNRLGVIPARARLAAPEVRQISPKVNIRVKNFEVKSASDGFFRKGQKVEVACVIENSSDEQAKNFQALIRIPGKDVASQYMNALKAGGEIVLKGSFVLENSGLLYLACRADIGAALSESNENDNHEIAALHVLPI